MKLADIDPIDLAREVVSAAVDRIYSLAAHVDLHAHVRLEREGEPWDPRRTPEGEPWPRPELGASRWGAPESTTLGHAVVCLTLYAQRGHPLDAPLSEYLISLVGAADEDLDDLTEDTASPLGLVVRAALAREDLERARATRTSWLAALAGVTTARVRQLVAAGTLTETSGHIDPGPSTRWLGGRGIQIRPAA